MSEKFTTSEKIKAAKALAIGAFVLGNLGLVVYADAGNTSHEVQHHSSQSFELMALEGVAGLEAAAAAKIINVARDNSTQPR